MKTSRFLLLALSLLTVAAHALPSNCTVGTNVYYISQGGSDSHTQAQAKSKTTAWQHAPAMHSFTGTYSHTSGDCFVFRGGDTWTPSTDYMVVSFGGTSLGPDYYGVDTSWFSGGSWNRPIFDIAGTFPNTDAFNNSNIVTLNAAWVTFDWWEMIHGICALTPTQTNQTFFAINGKSGISVTNSYFHDFEGQAGGCGSGVVSGGVASGNGFGIWIYMTNSAESSPGTFSNNVVDGSDGSANQGYDVIVYDPANIDPFAYNVVHDVCSAFGGNFTLAHDNTIYNFGKNVGAFDCITQGIHAHAIRSNNDATVYNNVIHDVNDGAIALNPQTGGLSAVVNNVEWNVDNTSVAPTYGIQTGDGGGTTGNLYVSNNTIDCHTRNQCVRAENNLTSETISNEFHVVSSGTGICLDNAPFSNGSCGTVGTLNYIAGHSLYLTSSQATSDGYTSTESYPYSPISGTSPTVGIGADNASSWPSGISTSDTTDGCTESTVSGVVEAVCPTRTAVVRNTSWDAGGYEYPASTSYTITISSITGNGTITSSDSVIDCVGISGTLTGTCSDATATGTITLTATPAAGSSLTVWGGGCSGSSLTCSVTTTATVTATFASSAAQGRPVTQMLYPCPTSTSNSNLVATWNGGVLQGCVFEFAWNSIDQGTGPSGYTWSTFDTQNQAFVSAFPGLKLGIVFAPASDLSPNSGTPNYVLWNTSQHTVFCSAYAGDKSSGQYGGYLGTGTSSTDTTGAPDPLDPPFQAAWWGTPATPGFVYYALQHIKSVAYLQSIAYVAFGFQRGGENYPTCNPTEQGLLAVNTEAYLRATWSAGNANMAKMIASALPAGMPGFMGIACIGNSSYPSTSNNCDLADAEAAAIAASGLGLRLTIYRDSDRINLANGAPTESDWVAMFAKYNVPMDAQEGQESNPFGACSSNTGTWVQAIPFIASHYGRATAAFHEGLENDWFGVFSSSYHDSCWPNGDVTSYPYAPYVNVLTNMKNGSPAGTGAVQ